MSQPPVASNGFPAIELHTNVPRVPVVVKVGFARGRASSAGMVNKRPEHTASRLQHHPLPQFPTQVVNEIEVE
jgi:hypothetical protein